MAFAQVLAPVLRCVLIIACWMLSCPSVPLSLEGGNVTYTYVDYWISSMHLKKRSKRDTKTDKGEWNYSIKKANVEPESGNDFKPTENSYLGLRCNPVLQVPVLGTLKPACYTDFVSLDQKHWRNHIYWNSSLLSKINSRLVYNVSA